MRALPLALTLVVLGAGAGCGGGGSSAVPASGSPATTTATVQVTTTTTAVTPEVFGAALCAAGSSVSSAPKAGVAGNYMLTAKAYGTVVPTADKKADLDSLVEASRALGALWSDAAPTTPEMFSEQFNKLFDTYADAALKLRVECPPQPEVTTTLASAVAATSRLYAVAHEEKGKGLWWYTSFACPEAKKVKLGPGLTAVKGQGGLAAAVLDEAAGAADPFNGALANESYDRIDEKIKATCV